MSQDFVRHLCVCAVATCLFLVNPLYAADSRSVAESAFDELVRQDFAALAKRFSPEMRAAAPEDRMAAQLGAAVRSLGPLRGARPQPRSARVQNHDVFVFPAEFQDASLNIQISINADGQVAGLYFNPPDPQPGELLVVTGDIRLPATLTVPEGSGPFPAVVLVHGSGPLDRDETVAANAPFKDLAEGLAQRGIATLRYVKRTRQYPKSPVVTVKEEVIDDAVSALALLRRQPRIDAKRVCVLGHSLGGYLAPRIAQRDSAVAGVILLAGFVRPLEEVVREQLANFGAPPEAMEQFKRTAPASYWDDLKGYDPAGAAQKLAVPFLVLQGERDYQVTMKDFELLRAALKGRRDVTLKSYPKLNHLFLEGEGKSLPTEYSTPGHIPAYVLDDIAAFIKSSTGK
jgi:dienelactone hydrolase